MTDKLQIQIPEGYEIDTFDLKTGLVTFKKKTVERWRDQLDNEVTGYLPGCSGPTWCRSYLKFEQHNNIFCSKKEAQSALARAQLSQIIANDPRFGGPITDEEWECDDKKYVICRINNKICETQVRIASYEFLAFHTPAQRDLFLKENIDLIKQYFIV